MGNYFDYLEWRGDLSFRKEPMGVVDITALAVLAIIDFTDELGGGAELTIAQLRDRFFGANKGKKAQGLIIPADFPELLQKMADSKRFASVKVKSYARRIDSVKASQFAALTFETHSDRIIAFSGTDDTVAGWKENLDLAFETSVPAQKEAIAYLRDHVKADKTNYVAGHSKGGMLSMYSYVHADEQTKALISHVYSMDGPGVLYEEWDYGLGKVVTEIIPQDSVVGRIFQHYGKIEVVLSTNQGINQHDPFSWQILGKKYVLSNQTQANQEVQSAINETIASLTMDERRDFVWLLGYLIDYTGAGTLTELDKRKTSLLKGYLSIPGEKRKFLNRIFLRLAANKSIRNSFIFGIWENRKNIAKADEKKAEKAVKKETEKKKKGK